MWSEKFKAEKKIADIGQSRSLSVKATSSGAGLL